MSGSVRLGMNIDHVATVRNARGGPHPDPALAACLAEKAGADGITAHLREDRRHIVDQDIQKLKERLKIPLNLEMAATSEMLEIALKTCPHAVCLVPEKRQELTTEGGLNAAGQQDYLRGFTAKLEQAGIRVSLFIDAEEGQLKAAANIGASAVELHTGCYAETPSLDELYKLQKGAAQAKSLGLECHAGHGLTYETVAAVAGIPEIRELNIGHFIIGQAIFDGLEASVQKMKNLMQKARM